MAKKYFWLGMLAITLAFGMTVVGCDGGEKDVTVIFDPNGGKWADGAATKSVKVKESTYMSDIWTMVQNPTREGFTFKNWWADEPVQPPYSYSAGGAVMRDRTLYAQWAPQQ